MINSLKEVIIQAMWSLYKAIMISKTLRLPSKDLAIIQVTTEQEFKTYLFYQKIMIMQRPLLLKNTATTTLANNQYNRIKKRDMNNRTKVEIQSTQKYH